MTVDESVIGAEGVLERVVDASLSADAFGNRGLHVLATPALVGLFEAAAMRAVENALGPGERTVGSTVLMRHDAPTPVGDTVTVRAALREVDGARLWFDLEGEDSSGPIASGRHARFVVQDQRFVARLARHPGLRAGEQVV